MSNKKEKPGFLDDLNTRLEKWNIELKAKHIERIDKSKEREAELKAKYPELDWEAIEEELKY